MSTAKMVADSTQSDSVSDGRKRKKKVKGAKAASAEKKVVLPEDEDSDLDLKKEMHPISFYMKDKLQMVEEMFHSVRGASLERDMPELLKSMPLVELKAMCLEQLEVMSKKRILRILSGEESANISSSGTDDIDSDEDVDDDGDAKDKGEGLSDAENTARITVDGGRLGGEGVGAAATNTATDQGNVVNQDSSRGTGSLVIVDSTSMSVNETLSAPAIVIKTEPEEEKEMQETQPNLIQFPAEPEVRIKQEPVDPELDKPKEWNRSARKYRSRRSDSDSRSRSRSKSSSRSRSRSKSRRRRKGRRRRRSSRTSSSRSRSRSRRRGSSSSSSRSRKRKSSRSSSSSGSSSRSGKSRVSKEDAASLIEGDYEEAYTSGSEDGELVRKKVPVVVVKQEVLSDREESGGGGGSGAVDGGSGANAETKSVGDGAASSAATEGQIVEGEASKDTHSAKSGGGGTVLPSIMVDQMELLELEMRARAIKAMLMSAHKEEDESGGAGNGSGSCGEGGKKVEDKKGITDVQDGSINAAATTSEKGDGCDDGDKDGNESDSDSDDDDDDEEDNNGNEEENDTMTVQNNVKGCGNEDERRNNDGIAQDGENPEAQVVEDEKDGETGLNLMKSERVLEEGMGVQVEIDLDGDEKGDDEEKKGGVGKDEFDESERKGDDNEKDGKGGGDEKIKEDVGADGGDEKKGGSFDIGIEDTNILNRTNYVEKENIEGEVDYSMEYNEVEMKEEGDRRSAIVEEKSNEELVSDDNYRGEDGAEKSGEVDASTESEGRVEVVDENADSAIEIASGTG